MPQVVQVTDLVAVEVQPPQQRHRLKALYFADDVVAQHLQQRFTQFLTRETIVRARARTHKFRAVAASIQLLYSRNVHVAHGELLHAFEVELPTACLAQSVTI